MTQVCVQNHPSTSSRRINTAHTFVICTLDVSTRHIYFDLPDFEYCFESDAGAFDFDFDFDLGVLRREFAGLGVASATAAVFCFFARGVEVLPGTGFECAGTILSSTSGPAAASVVSAAVSLRLLRPSASP